MDQTSITDRKAGRARERLTEAQRLLLEKRLRGEVRTAASANRIRRRDGGAVQPMSWAQERLWFLDQMEPGSPFYNIPLASLVSARIDVERLERVYTEIVRRHEALRTVFRVVDGEPRQVILDPFPVRIEVGDLRGEDGTPPTEAAVRRFIAEIGARSFDLAEGPLLRVGVFRMTEEDSILFINVHHIVTDGWSMPIITREMEELYEAFSRGLPSPLAELEAQYADYAAWQREYLTGATLQRQVDYWRGHLEGAATLDLPTDRPRPAVLSHRGGVYRFVWPAALSEKLRRVMVETGASMNMVVMAGFYLMLHRYSGQDDLVVGTLLGNRNRRETEPLVGFFVNSAPVRARVAADATFRTFLKQVRTAVLDADAHQDLPFDRIVDAVKAERDPSRNPLFQVMYFHHTFVRQFHHREESEFRDEINVRSLFQETGITLVDTQATKFDLTFATVEMADGVMANMVEYSTDLFDEETIGRMMDHTRILLDGAADALDAPVATLAMVEGEEQARLLAWGRGPEGAPAAGTLPELLSRWVAAEPGAVAVEHGDGALTYAELDARAARVARRLAGRGVRAGDRVGVAAAPSSATAAAIVGCLRAGAAVVPLDPAYPAERLAFMAEDAGVKLALGSGDAGAALAGAGIEVMEVDGEGAEADFDAPTPESVAYVTYTSGSTGRPKAVATTHAALARTVSGPGAAAPLAPGDRLLAAASLSFDAGAWELWAPLAAGAASVGVDRDLLLSTADFAQTLRERGITAAFLTTQLFNRHVGVMPEIFSPLRQLLFGGEAVDPGAVRAALAAGAPARLVHVYGPTETAVFATGHEVGEVTEAAHTVPIGRPLGDTRAYVLDPAGNLCGVGVPGELCIGGSRVASGYLGRPELTAERFVADPFAEEAEARMYRSGDRVRWLADGTLEFLGRLDAQVKVRGFRIEPGEVEAALAAHPGVRQAAVVAREVEPGERRLVAYTSGEPVEGEALRRFLKERLPDHMIPSAFVPLEEIPLTPNGKVDRARLPDPTPGAAAVGSGYAAPRTRVEAVLARSWADVLRVERVGIHDNFFSLGGDSILSIRIIARAGEEGVRVTPKQVFVHQTIAELAAVAGSAAEVDAEQGEVTGEVPLTPVQRWFLEQDRPEPHHFNFLKVTEPPVRLELPALERAVEAVLAHHDELRARFRRVEGEWRQEIAPVGGPAPVEAIDLAALPESEREADFRREAERLHRSLSLDAGPLLRWGLFEMGEDRPQRLLVTAHHLVVDAVSIGMVQADLESAYRRAAAGEAPALPRKTTSFRRWAELLGGYARSATLRAELPFWTGMSAAAPLPVDRPGGENTEGAAVVHPIELDAETTRALLHEVPGAYATRPDETLLAALGLALRGWTGSGAFAVDLEGHGREDLFPEVDLSRTAGWFTSIHPVRMELPDGGPGEALKAVKEQLRAVPGKGMGFGLLRWMGDDDSRAALAAVPEPGISFNYLGQLGPDGSAGDAWPEIHLKTGAVRAPEGARTHLLGLDVWVIEGVLGASLTYAPGVHDPATVGSLADGFVRALREIVEHCRDPEAGGYTPSDFALADLDQEGLDAILSQLGD